MPLVTGAIVMWSGDVNEIPEGWSLCDGTNDTLDLRNRFIVGAGDTYNVGDTGGFTDAIVLTHNHPTITTNTAGAHTHNFPNFQQGLSNTAGTRGREGTLKGVVSSTRGNHTHNVTIGTTGSSGTNANLPPYYALAFIQQIE